MFHVKQAANHDCQRAPKWLQTTFDNYVMNV